MKPRLILHAGTHKTGTTSIQRFAKQNSRALLKRGLYYPDYSPLGVRLKDGHHAFAHAFSEQSQRRVALEEAVWLCRQWLEWLPNPETMILISAEALYRHVVGKGRYEERRRMYLERVAQALEPFDVEVVLVFRRPDNYARSLYQENIMQGVQELPAFDEWRRRLAGSGLNYYLNARLFREIFDDVRCLVFEDLIGGGGGLSARFFSRLGCDVRDIPDVGRVRGSAELEVTLMKNFANRYIGSKKEGRDFLRWLSSGRVRRALRPHLAVGEYDFWCCHEERQDFLRSREDDVRALAEEFFEARSDLFPTLAPESTAPPHPGLPEAVRSLITNYFQERR